MLCLPKPYGYYAGDVLNNGHAITIRWTKAGWPSPQDAERMAGMAMGYGCPPFVADRVRDCLRASGRYDCRITTHPRDIKNLACASGMLGFEVIYQETGVPAFMLDLQKSL